MEPAFRRTYDFSQPLDDLWEMIPETGWSFDTARGRARFTNRGEERAEIYLRPCCLYGDTYEYQFADGDSRAGTFLFGFLGGFEYITFELDFVTGRIEMRTHEFHKPQPRLAKQVSTSFRNLKLVRERDRLPGLPYEGSRVTLLLDDRTVLSAGEIDFLPESHCLFGLKGTGELSLSRFSIAGPARPRPEYVSVGLWQQSCKPTTAENVNALIEGVRQGAAAGVQILVTPETSLTGLRPHDPELSSRDRIQAELRRLQQAVNGIPAAPYTLIGYPDWIKGSEVEGATLDEVKINAHRFVRPDGSLGPRMAKVHSCEEGLWHGRAYNLQRVCGAEVAVGVCHDGKYQDVWAVGVMGGARLCIHPLGTGTPSGTIDRLLDGYRGLGTPFDAFWVTTNAGGGSAIVYPARNRKQPETLLAVPKDLTKQNPAYPKYAPMGDLLAHTTVRLWDALGAYPMRTLRSGARSYQVWSSLIPSIQDV